MLSRIRNSNIALLYILSILSTRFTKPLLVLRKTSYDHRPQRDSSKCSSNWRSIMTELNNKLRHFKTFFCPFFPAQVSRPPPKHRAPGSGGWGARSRRLPPAPGAPCRRSGLTFAASRRRGVPAGDVWQLGDAEEGGGQRWGAESVGRYRPPDNRSGPAGPARHSGEGGGGPGARGGTSPYPTVPAAYLPSNATGSVRSSPGSESMAAPTELRLLCARLWRLRWNSNGRNRFRHLCVDGGEAAEATSGERTRRAQWKLKESRHIWCGRGLKLGGKAPCWLRAERGGVWRGVLVGLKGQKTVGRHLEWGQPGHVVQDYGPAEAGDRTRLSPGASGPPPTNARLEEAFVGVRRDAGLLAELLELIVSRSSPAPNRLGERNNYTLVSNSSHYSL